MPPEPLYFDHAATTPLLPQAREAWLEGVARWANPSSPHAAGRAARAALEDARDRVRTALGWTGEVLFTSGASEALAIGLGRAKVERRIVSAVEHDAVWRAAPGAEVIGTRAGEVERDALATLLAQPGRAVVAVQSINSETGTCLTSRDLGEQVRAAGGLFLSDCSQSAGKMPLPDADLAVVSAHKLGGPPGIGALLVRDFAMLEPSGGQERGYRAGTENLPGALGVAAALEAGDIVSWATTTEQRLAFREALARCGEIIEPGRQCSHIFAVAGRSAANTMLIRMDSAGFAISAGSACSSGTLKPSRVLQGFDLDPDVIRRTVRVSLGWSTTPAELDAFADAWDRANR
ncbi:cysteine desulfurase family protein [Novosphingobium sp. 9U]|uniref:cysteine desulfurase family protein n=1 Tax=Novosphingobium sp. 9U TaxID=2653158 RepID=UPI0012F444CB|nr:aminotransferase class V-fold PLP-dependent enzyme [Novosphingobium sp. 9U]VWX51276.1 Cysteine desulfurase [Novosphingobium sp. 9U]